MALVGTYDTEHHQAKLLLLDPQAVAYEWILRYIDNLNDMIDTESDYGRTDPIDIVELLEVAESHRGGSWGDYIVRGGAFEGYSLDMTFWDMYSTLLGEEIPQEDRNSFFSCSC